MPKSAGARHYCPPLAPVLTQAQIPYSKAALVEIITMLYHVIVRPTYVVSCPTGTKKILNGLYFKKGELETAKDRIRKLSEIVDTTKQPGFDQDDCQPSSYKADIIRQKEEMINCLQDELIKVRLREAENEESIRNLGEKVSELEEVCIFF